MDKQELKRIGKKAVQKGILSTDEFKEHAKKFMELKERGADAEFLDFLRHLDQISEQQIEELEATVAPDESDKSKASPAEQPSSPEAETPETEEVMPDAASEEPVTEEPVSDQPSSREPESADTSSGQPARETPGEKSLEPATEETVVADTDTPEPDEPSTPDAPPGESPSPVDEKPGTGTEPQGQSETSPSSSTGGVQDSTSEAAPGGPSTRERTPSPGDGKNQGPSGPTRRRTGPLASSGDDDQDERRPGSIRDRRQSSSSSTTSVFILLGIAVLLAGAAAGGYYYWNMSGGGSGETPSTEENEADGAKDSEPKGKEEQQEKGASGETDSEASSDEEQEQDNSDTNTDSDKDSAAEGNSNKETSEETGASDSSTETDSEEGSTSSSENAGGSSTGNRSESSSAGTEQAGAGPDRDTSDDGSSEESGKVAAAKNDDDDTGSDVSNDRSSSGEKSSSGAEVSAPEASAGESGELAVSKRIHRPEPVPELPDAFDSFDPPAVTVDEGLGVSKWTLTGGPGDTLAIGGYGFTSDTTFTLYASGENGSMSREITPTSVEEFRAMLTLPEDTPEDTVYFLYPTTGEGRGQPAIVNRAKLWFSLPRHPHPGQVVSVYGRNLSHNLGEKKSWVYLKPKGKEVIGTWTDVTMANPYRVKFRLPDDLETGQAYEVWVHNGHAGNYGWYPLHTAAGGHTANNYLTVKKKRKWDGPRINVVDMGANPNDEKSDSDALDKALEKANSTRNATIYFPEGTYVLKKQWGPIRGKNDTGVRIMGAGRDSTLLAGTKKNPQDKLITKEGNNVTFRDLSIDWELNVNKSSDEGIQDHAVLVGSEDYEGNKGLKLLRVNIDAQKQRPMTIENEQEFIIRDCVLKGAELNMGAPKDALIENTDFYGTTHAGVMMYVYGGWNISISNSRGLNRTPEDPAVGRWFTSTTLGNRFDNFYLGNNETKNLMPSEDYHDQNQGEQVMWEGIGVIDQQRPKKVDGDKFILKDALHHDKSVDFMHSVLVTAGKGLGQVRLLGNGGAASDKNKWDAHPGWTVQPNENSTLSFPWSVNRFVAYNNRFDARPRAVNSESHIASSGIQPWGSSVEVIIDNNTFHETRTGLSLSSFDGNKRAPTPTFFHLIQNNTFDTVRWGIGGGSSVGKNQKPDLPGPSTLGVIFRDNTFKNIKKRAVQWGINGREGVRAFDLMTFEGNKISDTPQGIIFDGEPSSSFGHLGLYENVLKLGSTGKSGSIGIQLMTKDRLFRKQNAVEGFEKNWKFGSEK